MDTGDGKFELLKLEQDENEKAAKERMEKEHPNHGGWFRVGEIIEIRGSLFVIKSVKPIELRLKLLPKERHGIQRNTRG
jgi:uncharacterized Zn finger protein